MSGIVLHPAAFAELEEIWEFIAAHSWTPRIEWWRRFTLRSKRWSHSQGLAMHVPTCRADQSASNWHVTS
jgi:hypothetical protein